jgi:exosortase A-associated hydrolase 1
MNDILEQAIIFNVAGNQLMAICHKAHPYQEQRVNELGVLIVVGGPQYRVGSHRQFVQLSRSLAKNGISSMRMDSRGMGDSGGKKQAFDEISLDIKAAIDTYIKNSPEIKKIIIWGLCDAASAALIYANKDPRVSGLVLLNPWLRSEQAMGKTMVKYYYLQRLLSKSFWLKLFSGRINVRASVGEAKGYVKDSVIHVEQDNESYQIRMLTGLQAFTGKICLILSGNDLTAKEFDQQTKNSKAWGKLQSADNQIHYVPLADHTFSSKSFKKEVENITEKFVRQII